MRPGPVLVQGPACCLALERGALFARGLAAAAASCEAAAAAAGKHKWMMAPAAVADSPVAVACHPGRLYQPAATGRGFMHMCQ